MNLPLAERLAAVEGIGDERAFALSEASGIPLKGGATFLQHERDLRAAFTQDDMSAAEMLRRTGIPMREGKPAHELAADLDRALPAGHEDRSKLDPIIKAGAAINGDQQSQLEALSVKHKGLLEGLKPDTDDLKDAEDGEDITDAVGASLTESEARGLWPPLASPHGSARWHERCSRPVAKRPVEGLSTGHTSVLDLYGGPPVELAATFPPGVREGMGELITQLRVVCHSLLQGPVPRAYMLTSPAG